MGRVKRIWYLSHMRAAKVQASLRIRAVSPEPSLLAHTSRESRGTFRQKTRSLAPLNGWACAVKICHDGMLEDTNSRAVARMLKLHCSNFRIITAIISCVLTFTILTVFQSGLVFCSAILFWVTFRAVLKSSTSFSHCTVCFENWAALACNILVSVSNFFWLT